MSRSGKSAPKRLEPEPYKGLEFDFIIFDEATYMAYYNNPDNPDPFEARWLREKREREQRALLEIMREKLREPRGLEQYLPAPKPERGDYLVYYLGGPNNATQEYFWNEQMPHDGDMRDIPEREPIGFLDTPPKPLRSNRYKAVVIPKNETPFATVQVYLALYQEPPL